MKLPLTPITSWLWTTVVQKQQTRLVNCAVGSILCAGSDGVAQHLEQQQSSSASSSSVVILDYHRMFTAGGIGILCTGFIYPWAYAQLDRVLGVGTGWRTLLTKSVVEIATVGIAVNTLSLTTRGWFQATRQRQNSDISSRKRIFQHVARELPTVTLNDAKVWLPYNFVAFSLIPAPVRPITTACMEAGWQTYISVRAHAHTRMPLPQRNSTT